MEYRLKRQITIVSILASFLLVVLFSFFWTNKEAPSCFDNILNQDEENVDCGGSVCAPCKSVIFEDIQVLDSFVVYFDGGYDAVARIKNPNSQYGVNNLTYKFKFYDKDNNFISEVSGRDYILSGKSKYIIASNIKLDEVPAYAKFEIGPTLFKEQKRTNIKLPIFSKRYEKINEFGSSVKSQVSGILENQTNYSFVDVDLVVLLFDKNGNVIATNQSRVNNLRSGERRNITVPWFSDVNGQVFKVVIEAYANSLDDSNILR